MYSFDRPLLAVLVALATVAIPVLFYSLHVEAKPLETNGIGKPTQVWLGELAPAGLPEIVITAKRSTEFEGHTGQADRGSGRD